MSESLSWSQDAEGLVVRYLANPRPDIKDLIMVQCATMVERIARRFSGVEPQEDLVQVGYIGLLNALSKFDPEAGVRFNTYATYLIAGEIKHYLRDRTMTIRHPAWLQELRSKVNGAVNLLSQEYGRLPSEREIADSLEVSETSVREVFQTQDMLKVASLDQPLAGEDSSSSESEKLDASDFCPQQISMEDRLVLEQAMSQLRDVERQVLVLFHFDALNQTEIAARLGISCNYVSHILRQSLAKLRKILTVEEENDRVLRRQAHDLDYDIIDAETGAYTEAFFKARLEEEIHRSSAEETTVAIVIVNFKGLEELRDFYGEASMRDFLSDAAEFLKGNVRRLDIVCKYGETGFAVIFPETGLKVALVRKRLLQKSLQWMSARCSATGSIMMEVGQSSTPDDGKTAAKLIKSAKLLPAHIAGLQIVENVKAA